MEKTARKLEAEKEGNLMIDNMIDDKRLNPANKVLYIARVIDQLRHKTEVLEWSLVKRVNTR